MIIGQYPFERFINPQQMREYQAFLSKIKPKYNLNNFSTTYLPKIYAQINLEQYHFLTIYVFELLKQWVALNEAYTIEYINKISKLIWFLEIENYFSFKEKAYLEKISSIEFVLNRKLKTLIPHFDMLPKEATYFFYETVVVSCYLQKQLIERLDCNLIITNQRIALSFGSGFYLFHFSQIKLLTLVSDGIIFELEKIKIKLKTLTPEVIYLSIDRIIDMEQYPI